MNRFFAVMTAGVVMSAAAQAQVGYPPAQSPFIDIEQKHEITPFFGFYRAKLDPAQPIAGRNLGTTAQPLYAADAFLAVSLTGERSWYHVMPMVGAGVGLVTNLKKADVGGFKFGTRFAFPWSAGVRWVPGGGHLQFRADVKDWMYTIAYPQAYYVSTTSDAAILPSTERTSRWTNNFAMTVGVSYIFKH